MSTVDRAPKNGGIAALVILLALIATGTLVGSMVISILSAMSGIALDPKALTELDEGSRMAIRSFLMVNQVFSFILPGVVFLRFFKPESQIRKLYPPLSGTSLRALFISLAMLFCALPLVTYSYELNTTLLNWMGRSTDGTTMPRVLQAILQMDQPLAFLTNLILIALTPAIGEELVFRGLALPLFQRISGSVHLGIWLSAVMFSFFHFQIEGFLPRMVLGLVLGYSYYFTGSLWIPMILHFLNNGIQVVAIYSGFSQYTEMQLNEMPQVPVYVAILSTLCLFLTARSLQHYGRKSL